MTAAPSIEDRLASAWAFLRGHPRGFLSTPPVPARAAPAAGRHLLLPIARLDRPDRAAVGLVIDQDEAEAVASAMFAVPRESLTDDDVADACAEACNVLSGCLVDLLRADPAARVAPPPAASDALDLGLPRPLPADRYAAISLASHLLALYELEADHDSAATPGDVRLVVYDPLEGPWRDDPPPAASLPCPKP